MKLNHENIRLSQKLGTLAPVNHSKPLLEQNVI